MRLLVDLSSNNHVYDFRALAKYADGAWIKATEGATFTDPRAKQFHRALTAWGLRHGFYHFARPDHNIPLHEATHFCKTIGKPKRRDLRPVLDIEIDTQKWTGAASAEDWIHQFNQAVKHEIGVLPLLYSYPAYLENLRLRQPRGAGLWIAQYGSDNGTDQGYRVPHPWEKAVAHQFTSRGFAPGVAGYADLTHAPRLRPLLAYPIRGVL